MTRQWVGRVLMVLVVGLPYGAASAEERRVEEELAQVVPAQEALADEADTPAPAAVVTAAMAIRALEPPVIDGHNNDAIWRTAPEFSDFRQFAPRVDADPSFRTEFQVAFDQDRLYVYVRARDPHPDSIMRALTRRDVRGPSDQIGAGSSSTPTTTAGADSNSM